MKKTSTYARKRSHRLVLDAGMRLLHNARPYSPGEMTHEHIKTRIAFELLSDGKGGEDDFDRVSMILNVGLIRAESIDQSIVDTLRAGQSAFVRMKDRVLRGLGFGFDAQGLRDVPLALDAYEAVMDASSPLQMKQAIHEAYSRITGGHLLSVS